MPEREESGEAQEGETVVHNGVYYTSYNATHDVKEEEETEKVRITKRYTSTQWITLATLAFGNFCVGAIASLQAPFFPKEAEEKGATPTEYGLIFGAYQLTIFISAPIMGKLVVFITPKFLLNSGILTVGVSCVLFGILDFAPSGVPFVSLAFAVRIVEGIGAAALRTSVYTIIAAEFKEKMSTTFALLETFLGLGLITGPTLGGALYDAGGYGLPFFVMGSVALFDAVVICFVLPNPEKGENEKKADLLKFWLNPGIMMYSFNIFTSFNYIGFNSATLEPHLRRFNLSGVLLGLVFAISGAVYAITATFWGWLCDKKVGYNLLIFIGCCLTVVSLLLIGPMPFFNTETKLGTVIAALVIMGFALGAKLVCTFGGSFEDTIARGFPPDLSTYGLISSMFASSQSLGAFVGPSLGGYLLDTVGFRMATVVILCLEILLMILLSIYGITKKCRGRVTDEEKKPIIPRHLERRQSIF